MKRTTQWWLIGDENANTSPLGNNYKNKAEVIDNFGSTIARGRTASEARYNFRNFYNRKSIAERKIQRDREVW